MNLESGRILPGRILVRPLEERKQTSSGIYIPTDVIKPKTYAAKVLIVGESLPLMQMVVKKDDYILHSPNAFVSVTIEGEDLRLLNQQDVLFIWNE